MLIKKKRLKIMSLAIICFLLIGMYTPIKSIPALAADTGNIVSIVNSTFEDDDNTVWAVNGGGSATLTRTATEAQAGIKSLAVTNRTLAYQGPRVDVLGKIAAGTTYTTSVWVKFSGTGTKQFKVTLNSTTDSYKNMIDTFVPANTWTEITGTYTTSTSATPITSALVYVQCMDTTLDYYIDNFSMTYNAPNTGDSGTGGSDSGGTGGSGDSGSGDSGSDGSDSDDSNSGDSGSSDSEIIVNSTFEDDDNTIWSVNGGSPAAITRTTTEAQAGIKSLAVTKRNQTYQGPRVDVLGKIAPGTTYTTSVWVKFSGTGTQIFKVTLNSTTDSNKNMIEVSVPANEWTKITGTYKTSTSATPITSAKVFVQCMDATLDYYIDNFSMISDSGSDDSGSGDSGSDGSDPDDSDSGDSGSSDSGIIVNSTFEDDDATVWAVNGGGTAVITRTTTEAKAGIKSLAVTKRTLAYQGPRVDVLGKIAAGTTYDISFWVKFSGTEAKEFKVTLNSTTDAYKNMIDTFVPANTWTEITGTYTTSTSTTPITSAVVYVQCMDVTLDYNIDNFSITKDTSSSGSGGSGSGSNGSGSGGSGSGGSGSGSSGSGGSGSGGSNTSKPVNLIESNSSYASNNVINNKDTSENNEAAQSGWKLNGYNKWTYINNEAKVTGWNLINNKWYVFDVYGQMKTGWYKEAINGKWYFLNESGEMKTGWMKEADGKWYFLNNSGDMKTGWLQDTNGKWYFLNDSGEMLYNISVEGYTLGSDGAWIQ